MDYYPYGGSRIDEKTGSFADKHKYTGKELDNETGLYYYGQRYYNPVIGRFASLDPVFLTTSLNLSDPQQLNSYSYARNNPLRYVDPNGESISLAGIASQLSSISLQVQALASSIQSFASQAQVSVGTQANNLYQSSSAARLAMDHPYATGTAIGVAGGAVVYAGATAITSVAARYIAARTIAATATAVGGACQKYCPEAVNTETKLLNPPINNIAARMGHVMNNHTIGGAKTAGKSIFNAGENVTALIRQATQVPMQLQANGNFQRIFDVGKNIGIDRVTGQQTSIMTVITRTTGDFVTAFPGLP